MTAPRAGWNILQRDSDSAFSCARYDADLRMWQLPGRVLPAGWRVLAPLDDVAALWIAYTTRLPAVAAE